MKVAGKASKPPKPPKPSFASSTVPVLPSMSSSEGDSVPRVVADFIRKRFAQVCRDLRDQNKTMAALTESICDKDEAMANLYSTIRVLRQEQTYSAERAQLLVADFEKERQDLHQQIQQLEGVKQKLDREAEKQSDKAGTGYHKHVIKQLELKVEEIKGLKTQLSKVKSHLDIATKRLVDVGVTDVEKLFEIGEAFVDGERIPVAA